MNCSARFCARGSAPAHRVVRSACALIAAFGGAASAASLAELDDAASRLQYAHYTADARALHEVLLVIERFEVSPTLAPMRSYHLAYGGWRLAQALATDAPSGGAHRDARAASLRAAQSCVSHAAAAIASDPQMAEAHALQAVCEDFAPAAGAKITCRAKSLRNALTLAPANPRVRLIETLCTPGLHQPSELRRLVAAFEAAAPSAQGALDWGHAESLTMLGQSYLDRSDPTAARDALERALVIAPDYRRAQQLLQTSTARPR